MTIIQKKIPEKLQAAQNFCVMDMVEQVSLNVTRDSFEGCVSGFWGRRPPNAARKLSIFFPAVFAVAESPSIVCRENIFAQVR